MNASKNELREKYKFIRFEMSPDEVKSKSNLIFKKLLNEVNWQDIKKVLVYSPITKLNEVDPPTGRVKNVEFDVLDSSPFQPLPAKKYDLIIVPTLAFDKDNYRLGWGGGFYDRLLAEQPQALKIGLCFQNGFDNDGLPHEPHDIPLDKIITEL